MTRYESAKSAARRLHGPSRLDLSEDLSRDGAPTLTRCSLCPAWSHEGTAEAGRQAALAHRAECHPHLPGLVGKVKRRRKALTNNGGGLPSYVSPERERILIDLYLGGATVRDIVKVRWRAWGYGSYASLEKRFYQILRKHAVPVRARGRSPHRPERMDEAA